MGLMELGCKLEDFGRSAQPAASNRLRCRARWCLSDICVSILRVCNALLFVRGFMRRLLFFVCVGGWGGGCVCLYVLFVDDVLDLLLGFCQGFLTGVGQGFFTETLFILLREGLFMKRLVSATLLLVVLFSAAVLVSFVLRVAEAATGGLCIKGGGSGLFLRRRKVMP
jgi:hypothetical protein